MWLNAYRKLDRANVLDIRSENIFSRLATISFFLQVLAKFRRLYIWAVNFWSTLSTRNAPQFPNSLSSLAHANYEQPEKQPQPQPQ